MVRLFALCLFLIGLAAQFVPIATEAMPVMNEDPAMVAMADCTDCPEKEMSGSDTCQGVGTCASGAVALDLTSLDWPFFSATREARRVFGNAAPTGSCPAPLLEPPRPLI